MSWWLESRKGRLQLSVGKVAGASLAEVRIRVTPGEAEPIMHMTRTPIVSRFSNAIFHNLDCAFNESRSSAMPTILATSSISECGETNITDAAKHTIRTQQGLRTPQKWPEPFEIASWSSPRRASSDHASRHSRFQGAKCALFTGKKLLPIPASATLMK
jgi:hypothetical protein